MNEENFWVIWCGIGFVTYVIGCIIQAFSSDDYDFNRDVAENPNAGMAFFLSLVLGPFFTLIVIIMYISDISYQNNKKAKNEKISKEIEKDLQEIKKNLLKLKKENDREVIESFFDEIRWSFSLDYIDIDNYDLDLNDRDDREYFIEIFINILEGDRIHDLEDKKSLCQDILKYFKKEG